MRRVSRAALASATLALSSAAGSRWIGFPGSSRSARVGKKTDEERREAIGERQKQHREHQVEGGVEIDNEARRGRFDLRQQPGNQCQKRHHDDTAHAADQQIAERETARHPRARLEQRRQGAAEIGAEDESQSRRGRDHARGGERADQ
jgi:hypothetical protein